MINELSAIAEWLDSRQMYASANTVDDILIRTAQSEYLEEDNNDDEPETDIWRPKAYHQLPVVHSASPEFLEMMQHYNPSGHEKWTEQLMGNGYSKHGIPDEEHALTSYLGGNTLRLPKGFSKLSIPEKARFYFDEPTLQQNEDKTLHRYKALTRDQKHRGMFEGNYMSGSTPKDTSDEGLAKLRKPRDLMFDPHVLDMVKRDYDGKGGNPNDMQMPMFDPQMLRRIVDPTDDSDEAMEFRAKHGDKPFGTQAGYALRNLSPEQMFGMWRKLRETDEETGKKKPFYYPKLKK
jgi:hypothetical protein